MQQYETPNTLLQLTNDAVFKLYFENEENVEQLRQFLKATTELTDEDLTIIEIKNPKLTKQDVGEKDFIVDILVTSKTGKQVNIEMQVQSHAYFIERMVAYNARLYASGLQKGNDYSKLKTTISLIITDFEVFDDTDESYEHILFCRKNGKVFTTAQQFCILDLTKIPKALTDAKHMWGALFSAKTEEELKVLMETSNEMKQAGEKLLDLSADDHARYRAQKREDGRMLANTNNRVARQEGSEARATEIAQTLLKMGMPVEDVSQGTGVSIDTLKQIQVESQAY